MISEISSVFTGAENRKITSCVGNDFYSVQVWLFRELIWESGSMPLRSDSVKTWRRDDCRRVTFTTGVQRFSRDLKDVSNDEGNLG